MVPVYLGDTVQNGLRSCKNKRLVMAGDVKLKFSVHKLTKSKERIIAILQAGEPLFEIRALKERLYLGICYKNYEL